MTDTLDIEKMLQDVRSALKVDEFHTAFTKSAVVTKEYAADPRGWRLLIESSAKLGTDIEQTLGFYRHALKSNLLKGVSANQQAYHVVTDLLRNLRQNEVANLVALKQPSFSLADVETKSYIELFWLTIELFLDPTIQIGDKYASALGQTLAKLETKDQNFDESSWQVLIPTLLRRLKIFEKYPRFGIRNASAGILLLRYYFANSRVSSTPHSAKVANYFIDELTTVTDVNLSSHDTPTDYIKVRPSYAILVNLSGQKRADYINTLQDIALKKGSDATAYKHVLEDSIRERSRLSSVSEYSHSLYLFLSNKYEASIAAAESLISQSHAKDVIIPTTAILSTALYKTGAFSNIIERQKEFLPSEDYLSLKTVTKSQFQTLINVILARKQADGENSQETADLVSMARLIQLKNKFEPWQERLIALGVDREALQTRKAIVEARYDD